MKIQILKEIIKKKSSKVRANIFYQGLAIGFVLMLVLKPFKSCYENSLDNLNNLNNN